jgi:hypothetical protein
MREPTLREIGDYNTLEGEKRRVVWAVILSGLIIGAALGAAKAYYSDVSDALPVQERIGTVPFR